MGRSELFWSVIKFIFIKIFTKFPDNPHFKTFAKFSADGILL